MNKKPDRKLIRPGRWNWLEDPLPYAWEEESAERFIQTYELLVAAIVAAMVGAIVPAGI